MSEPSSTPRWDVRGLEKGYGQGANRKVVLSNVNCQIADDECVALVGESGSGKSTLGRCLMGLETIDAGELLYFDQPLAALKVIRDGHQRFSMVFQNPLASLNPRMRIRDLIAEPLLPIFRQQKISRREKREKIEDRVDNTLRAVGLDPAIVGRLPGSFSGGQCQRIAIARAIIAEPEFIVLDEPTAALDVSVQAQIVELLHRLRRERGLRYLFTTHDLALVPWVADRVLVMKAGQLVEQGPARQVLSQPEQPYTQDLIAAIPKIEW